MKIKASVLILEPNDIKLVLTALKLLHSFHRPEQSRKKWRPRVTADQSLAAENLRAHLLKMIKSDSGKLAERYRDAAARYARDGEIEIDPGAPVSFGDDHGAYVQAWLWIYKGDL